MNSALIPSEYQPLALVCLVVFGVAATVFTILFFRVKGKLAAMDRRLELEHNKSEQLMSDLQVTRNSLEKLDEQHKIISSEKHELEIRVAEHQTTLAKEKEFHEERIRTLEKAEEKLKEAFSSLSSEALKSNNDAFLKLANSTFEKLQQGAQSSLKEREKAIETMVDPITKGLKRFDDRIHEMEKGRVAQISTVSELVQNLQKANEATRIETSNLVTALKAPNIRGQWGEMQLKRTIEIAGMLKYCDFVEQESIGDEDSRLRPDVVVNLPNNRKVIIDAKAPLNAYLEANEAPDLETRSIRMKMHSKQIRDHLRKLGQKSYHELLDESPEFVVLFLPGEVFYSSALEEDPGLIEFGVDQKVLLATPTTLIALLKAIAYGWKNQEIAEQAGEISKLGRDLYDSVVKMLEHLGNVRRSLNQTVDHFNQTLRSTDRRLLPRIRKFKALNAGSDKDIPQLTEIDSLPEKVDLPDE